VKPLKRLTSSKSGEIKSSGGGAIVAVRSQCEGSTSRLIEARCTSLSTSHMQERELTKV
jgi:hypothetical protein